MSRSDVKVKRNPPSKHWSIRDSYKGLATLPQLGTTLEVHSSSPRNQVFVSIISQSNFSLCPILLPSLLTCQEHSPINPRVSETASWGTHSKQFTLSTGQETEAQGREVLYSSLHRWWNRESGLSGFLTHALLEEWRVNVSGWCMARLHLQPWDSRKASTIVHIAPWALLR